MRCLFSRVRSFAPLRSVASEDPACTYEYDEPTLLYSRDRTFSSTNGNLPTARCLAHANLQQMFRFLAMEETGGSIFFGLINLALARYLPDSASL